MSKAIPMDVKALGFTLSMFEDLEELSGATSEDFDTWIQGKLDKATLDLKREIPSDVYDKTELLDLIVEAEANLAGANMARIKRMISSEDQDTVSLGPIGGLGNSGRTFQAFGNMSKEFQDRANELIAKLKKYAVPPVHCGMYIAGGG